MNSKNEFIQTTKLQISDIDEYDIFAIKQGEENLNSKDRIDQLSRILGEKIPNKNQK